MTMDASVHNNYVSQLSPPSDSPEKTTMSLLSDPTCALPMDSPPRLTTTTTVTTTATTTTTYTTTTTTDMSTTTREGSGSGSGFEDLEAFESDPESTQSSNSPPTPPPLLPLKRPYLVVSLPSSTLTTPASHFQTEIRGSPGVYGSPYQAIPECLAIDKLAPSPAGYLEVSLDDFVVYTHSGPYPNEMRPLNFVACEPHFTTLYFDGLLRHKGKEFRVSNVPFAELSIGNYGLDCDSVSGEMWIRSVRNKGKQIYYKLGQPAQEYVRFFTPFLWLADLGKHMVDYLADEPRLHRLHQKQEHKYPSSKPSLPNRVSIHHFAQDFSDFMLHHHRNSATFQTWYNQHDSNPVSRPDFRRMIANYSKYLHKEAVGVLGNKAIRHPLWSQVYPGRLEYIPQMKPMMGPVVNGFRPTICTRFIFDLFNHLPFAHMLHIIKPCAGARSRRKQQLLNFASRKVPETISPINMALEATPEAEPEAAPEAEPEAAPEAVGVESTSMIAALKPGITISTLPDPENISSWKREQSEGMDEGSDECWYGVIQRVHQTKNGLWFDVAWIYKPVDTPCAVMRYPYPKELFVSDHCTCESNLQAKIHQNDVLAAHTVEWGGNPNTKADFFIRQAYQSAEKRWVTLQDHHMRCEHNRNPSDGHEEDTGDAGGTHRSADRYVTGDTVLVRLPHMADSNRLEPCEVVLFDGEEKVGNDDVEARKSTTVSANIITIRRLFRRREVDPDGIDAPPNELVYSSQYVTIKPSAIFHRCYVRFFPPSSAGRLPPPYNRDGTGNFFYLSRAGNTFEPLTECPKSLNQAFDPTDDGVGVPKLRGLDLFCGGGNLGRGLEEGCAVENRWCNDYWGPAIHTYIANTPDGQVEPIFGSCDDLLHKAMLARFQKNVPAPGDVDQISGGSPCQGFSRLTRDKTNPAQRKNQSMVASFCSYIDFYRPMYGILENVPSMVQQLSSRKSDVFSQMVCAIVGMGYQCQMNQLDAWNFGAPQQRSRVILLFARPDVRLPHAPVPSHYHPSFVKKGGIGKISNGDSFHSRDTDLLAGLKFVTAKESVSDLPNIRDAKPGCVPTHPDHRLSHGFSSRTLTQLRLIPTQPFAMNLAKTFNSRTFSNWERDIFIVGNNNKKQWKNRNGYGRIHPHKLFRTLSTSCSPSDGFTGTLTHWEQTRPITLLEAKRAQGYLDTDVLVGFGTQQWKVIGNSVARQVGIAIGLAVREAYYGSNMAGRETIDQNNKDEHREMDISAVDDGYSDTEDEEDEEDDIDKMTKWDRKEVETSLKRQRFSVEIISRKRARVEEWE